MRLSDGKKRRGCGWIYRAGPIATTYVVAIDHKIVTNSVCTDDLSSLLSCQLDDICRRYQPKHVANGIYSDDISSLYHRYVVAIKLAVGIITAVLISPRALVNIYSIAATCRRYRSEYFNFPCSFSL